MWAAVPAWSGRESRGGFIHEASIATNIVTIVERAAAANALVSVREVVLEIGDLSGVQIEALKFAFQIIKDGSILEEADIVYHSCPVVMRCLQCTSEYVGDLEDALCPVCGCQEYTIIRGRELLVKSISGV